MEIKTLQWNIGGAKDANNSRLDVLKDIVEIIRRENPDFITLQEVHSKGSFSQAKLIADILGYAHFINDEYDDSHIESGFRLGQSIISKYPSLKHSFQLFKNPNLSIERPDGSTWVTHDRGITTCMATVDSIEITVQTLHVTPFHRFNVDYMSDEAREARESLNKYISDNQPLIVQGDFNFNNSSLSDFVAKVGNGNIEEIKNEIPTRPNGKISDHILYRGLKLEGFIVISEGVKTDHFPIVASLSFT